MKLATLSEHEIIITLIALALLLLAAFSGEHCIFVFYSDLFRVGRYSAECYS